MIYISVLDVSSLVEKNERLEKVGIRLNTRLNMTQPPTPVKCEALVHPHGRSENTNGYF